MQRCRFPVQHNAFVAAFGKNFFLALGKAYYRQEAYTAAMKYFKLSGDRTQYSKAYKEYRRQVINDSFSTVMTCLSVLAAGIVVLVCVRRRKGRKAGRGGVDR